MYVCMYVCILVNYIYVYTCVEKVKTGLGLNWGIVITIHATIYSKSFMRQISFTVMLQNHAYFMHSITDIEDGLGT